MYNIILWCTCTTQIHINAAPSWTLVEICAFLDEHRVGGHFSVLITGDKPKIEGASSDPQETFLINHDR